LPLTGIGGKGGIQISSLASPLPGVVGLDEYVEDGVIGRLFADLGVTAGCGCNDANTDAGNAAILGSELTDGRVELPLVVEVRVHDNIDAGRWSSLLQ
jgi:hypothetical protein